MKTTPLICGAVLSAWTLSTHGQQFAPPATRAAQEPETALNKSAVQRETTRAMTASALVQKRDQATYPMRTASEPSDGGAGNVNIARFGAVFAPIVITVCANGFSTQTKCAPR